MPWSWIKASMYTNNPKRYFCNEKELPEQLFLVKGFQRTVCKSIIIISKDDLAVENSGQYFCFVDVQRL